MKIKESCCNDDEVIEMDAYFQAVSLSASIIHDPRSLNDTVKFYGKWRAVCPKCGESHSRIVEYAVKFHDLSQIMESLAEIRMDENRKYVAKKVKKEDIKFIPILP